MTSLKSWSSIPKGSHFSLSNIPYGIISTQDNATPRVATVIGSHVLDLSTFAAGNGFSALSTIQPHQGVFSSPTLNAYAALGRPIHAIVRKYIQSIFSLETPYPTILKENEELMSHCLIPLSEVTTHLPFQIGDYTDFFAGSHHARNCAKIFNVPLQPNYVHLPVGYHGRASSVVVSGTSVRRPSGQIRLAPGEDPIFSACRKLDFELELGCFVCTSNELGVPVSINEAEKHLFGVVLLNDWSARDIQSWEMQPLGPFNSKNFATTISPWVVTMDALEPFLGTGIERHDELLPYLQEGKERNIPHISLSVELSTARGAKKKICDTNSRNLLYSFAQMLTHHTVGGCNLSTGDLLGSGTISSPDRSGYGALLEITDNEAISVDMGNGETRTFLQDGDTVRFSGVCGTDDENLVGFGTLEGTVLPALEFNFG